MGQITNGIDKIEVGETGANGTMGSVLDVLGYTNIDSASMTEADGTTTDFNVEELDTPLYSRTTPGKITLTFQVADPNLVAFQKVFGGTITGTGSAAVWNAPQSRPDKEWSVKITPKVGFVIQVPRAKLTPKMNMNLGKNNLSMIEITLEVLTPQDSATAPIALGGTVDDSGTPGQAQTITFASLGTKSIGADSPLTLNATASSGLPVTYMSDDPTKATVNGSVVTLLAAGTVNIIATQPGNATYAAATPVVNEMTVTT